MERLLFLLTWQDASVRGTAAWALGHLGDERAVEPLRELADDQARLEIWDAGVLRQASVAELAEEAIDKIIKTNK